MSQNSWCLRLSQLCVVTASRPYVFCQRLIGPSKKRIGYWNKKTKSPTSNPKSCRSQLNWVCTSEVLNRYTFCLFSVWYIWHHQKSNQTYNSPVRTTSIPRHAIALSLYIILNVDIFQLNTSKILKKLNSSCIILNSVHSSFQSLPGRQLPNLTSQINKIAGGLGWLVGM